MQTLLECLDDSYLDPEARQDVEGTDAAVSECIVTAHELFRDWEAKLLPRAVAVLQGRQHLDIVEVPAGEAYQVRSTAAS